MSPARNDPDQRASHPVGLLRRLLLTPLTDTGVRIVDIVILPIGAVVAVFVCMPILIVTTIAGVGIALVLQGLGLPKDIAGLFGLAGFIGGLALGFVALVWLYRRLPARIRSWATPADEPPILGASPLSTGRDPDADDATLASRVATADATHASADRQDNQINEPEAPLR